MMITGATGTRTIILLDSDGADALDGSVNGWRSVPTDGGRVLLFAICCCSELPCPPWGSPAPATAHQHPGPATTFHPQPRHHEPPQAPQPITLRPDKPTSPQPIIGSFAASAACPSLLSVARGPRALRPAAAPRSRPSTPRAQRGPQRKFSIPWVLRGPGSATTLPSKRLTPSTLGKTAARAG